jgi:hypothetical protein
VSARGSSPSSVAPADRKRASRYSGGK